MINLPVSSTAAQRWHPAGDAGWIGFAFGTTAILSGTGALQANGLCLDTWYLFSLGVLSYGVVWRVRSVATVVSRRAGHRDLQLGSGSKLSLGTKAAGIATAASLVWVGRWNGLHTLGSWRPLQFLAAISYSLYLIHGIVGWRVMSVGQRVTGTGLTWATLWFVVALAMQFSPRGCCTCGLSALQFDG